MNESKVTARVPSELRKRLKLLAVHEGTTLEALLAEAIKALLDGRKQAKGVGNG